MGPLLFVEYEATLIVAETFVLVFHCHLPLCVWGGVGGVMILEFTVFGTLATRYCSRARISFSVCFGM